MEALDKNYPVIFAPMDKLVKSALSKGAVLSVRIGVGVPNRTFRCGHSVMVALHVVTLSVRVQIPLVTPKCFMPARLGSQRVLIRLLAPD